jgi:hypothetical protein
MCLEAALWILNTVRHMLPQIYPNYETVHRRFHAWLQRNFASCFDGRCQRTSRQRARWMKKNASIDATFVVAKGGGSVIGTTKRGEGMKIMAIVDRHGSVSTHAANHHEVRLV